MLNIENLKASYGKVEVLHGISINVPKGIEVLAGLLARYYRKSFKTNT